MVYWTAVVVMARKKMGPSARGMSIARATPNFICEDKLRVRFSIIYFNCNTSRRTRWLLYKPQEEVVIALALEDTCATACWDLWWKKGPNFMMMYLTMQVLSFNKILSKPMDIFKSTTNAALVPWKRKISIKLSHRDIWFCFWFSIC